MKTGLTFNWIGGNTTASDHMIKCFKAHGIQFRYNWEELEAALDGIHYVAVDYKHVAGDLFDIIVK